MAAKAHIHAKVDSSLKEEVGKILEELGLNFTDAITLYFKLIKLNKGLPFEVKIPNEKTLAAMEDAEQGKNVTRYKSVDDMFEDAKNW